ncbi:MAG: polyphosphate kinase 2 family protein [Dongiaceae bacterium]
MGKMSKSAAKRPRDLRKHCRVPDYGKGFKLMDRDPGDKKAFSDRAKAEAEMAADITRIDELQDTLWAQARHAVMVVFQAMDAGGKDGTIKKVFGPVDPLGLMATSFKKPTDKELAQDYLWRVHQAVPPRGMIGLFNRSHYEDVLVVRVHALAPPEKIEQRYDQVNAFEKHLAENGVTILKFFLNISKEEQKERLQDRINDPTKRWKFNPADLNERKLWKQYMSAYELALTRCSTPWAPWYVIPADRNWYRNALVARIVRTTLEDLNPRYPAAPKGIEKLVVV